MTPGSTIIKKCKDCFRPIAQNTIASGNTFGAVFWTDGKSEAPMLPDQPWLIKCPHCHALLWIDELEELGQVEDWGDEDNKFKDTNEFDNPIIEDYFALLLQGVVAPEKERYVRLRAWWSGNDERRNKISYIPMTSLEKANLTAFVQILDESDATDLVMKAEAMRELGRFDEALSLLVKSVSEDTEQAVKIISDLSEQGDPYVREIHFK
jgi:hypothetical protein